MANLINSIVVQSAADLDRALMYLNAFNDKLPITIEVFDGKKRTKAQNRLQHMWYAEIASHTGEDVHEVRARCKLQMGVPILRAENEDFLEKYDRLVKPLPFEVKLELMVEPIAFPVTSLMSVNQKIRFLDAVQRHHLQEGIALTDPDQAYKDAVEKAFKEREP